MTETEFLQRADKIMTGIEQALSTLADDQDVDVEIDRSGNVLQIETDTGAKIILTLQTPMREVWIAARMGGFHYRWDGTSWVDTRNGGELFSALSNMLTEVLEVPIQLLAPQGDASGPAPA